jgi:ABC-type transport system involved in cytochrome c biogenesis permease subunit
VSPASTSNAMAMSAFSIITSASPPLWPHCGKPVVGTRSRCHERSTKSIKYWLSNQSVAAGHREYSTSQL